MCFSDAYDKEVALSINFAIMKWWQQFGNRKSVSQNKLCN